VNIEIEKFDKKRTMLLKGSPVRTLFKALPYIAKFLKFSTRNVMPGMRMHTDSVIEMVIWSPKEERTSIMESLIAGAVVDYISVTARGTEKDEDDSISESSTTLLSTAGVSKTGKGLETICISGEVLMGVRVNEDFDKRTEGIPDIEKFVMLANFGRQVLAMSKLVENEDGEKEFDIRADELYAITKREINNFLYVR
jgi:hypothetical protein